MQCTAFLGMSLDGFIAGTEGDVSWLDEIPAPTENDMGFTALMDSIDALVMGRTTFEFVANFDGPWPYTKPVVVMSSSLSEVPAHALDTELTTKLPEQLCAELEERGWSKLYVDGGAVVGSFHDAGLLNELIVTVVPVVLGDGVKLMGGLVEPAWLTLQSVEAFDNDFVQLHYTFGR